MGVALADVDGDTTPDLYLTDWGENELYLNPTPGGPVVEAQKELRLEARHDPASGTALISWGARFLDLDRDGLLELFVVNGTVGEAFACEAWRQLDRYYRRPAASAPYQDVTALVGLPATASCDPSDPAAGRGVAIGDLDGDGDDDLVVAGFVETSRVYENATPPAHHRLRVRLRGTVSSPEAIGAVLRVDTAAGTQVRHLYAGGDTHSASDPVLEVGLGTESTLLSVEVEWPSGRLQDITSSVIVDGQVTIVEPAWLTALPRVATAAEPAPVLHYLDTPGRTVTAVRSDGVPVVVSDLGDGRYQAPLPHPGSATTSVITLTVDGVTLRPRPRVTYR
jgi:hypothetical protein